MKYKIDKEADKELADKIRKIMEKLGEPYSTRDDNRVYYKIKKTVLSLDHKKWKVTSGRNWKGTKIEGIMKAEVGPITITLEDKLNQGIGFYLQIYDKDVPGLGRIGDWFKAHEDTYIPKGLPKSFGIQKDSLYKDISKYVK